MNLEDYNIEYWIGDKVYLITDLDQVERIVIGITLRPNGFVSYAVAYDSFETHHFDIEMSKEKDMSKI